MSKYKEIKRGEGSLVCLLQGLEGMRVTIELRNEDTATGIIESVDSGMGMSLQDVTFTKYEKPPMRFEAFFVMGKHIRYVHIPDEVRVETVIQQRIKKTADAGKLYKRKKPANRQRLPY